MAAYTRSTPGSEDRKPHDGVIGCAAAWLPGVNDHLTLAADRRESLALDLERAAAGLRRLAVELRSAEPAKHLPALTTIRDARLRTG